MTESDCGIALNRKPGARAARIRRRYHLGSFALAALFFLMCFPLLDNVSRWRGDERFYTDAVIGMIHDNNYFMPTYSDGVLRFKKPILTYWAILASYKVLGVNYLASRLPFLISGALVVWLTYRLALILVRRRPEAWVASAIMASNLTVLHTSIRSTPDMILTLFIMMSMIGFTNLIFMRRVSLWNYGLAYLGAALAVATKGLMGLIPVLYVFGYVRLVKPKGITSRDLIHGRVLLATIPVALFWFVWAFLEHGGMAAQDFWGDQVGGRFSGSKWYIVSNAAVYLVSFIVQMLPWSLPALVVLFHGRRNGFSLFLGRRRELVFMAGWVLTLYVVFIFGNILRTRYFLSAYPHLSIVIAGLLCAGFRKQEIASQLGRIMRSLLWMILVSGVGLMVGGIFIRWSLFIAGLIFVSLAFWLISRSRRWAPAPFMVGVGMLLITVFTVGDMMVRSVFYVSPAPDFTRRILALHPAGTSVGMMGVSLNYVSQIRVLSQGRVSPVDLGGSAPVAALEKFALIACPKSDFEQGKTPKGRVVGEVWGISNWRPRDYVGLCLPRRREAIWAARREEYCLIVPDVAGASIRGTSETHL